ncbi:MAG: response regulator [bacterium]|nr:response regulator [bacterium]
MAKIMLVEDDNNLREIYEARLLAEGYEIVSAHDGEEALAIAIKEKPDLIISDIMMPKISGFDMLDILRGTPETKNTKVIMMTALSQAEDQARAGTLGADKYLVKSQVTLEDVARVAREVLESAKKQPAAEPSSQPDNPMANIYPNPGTLSSENATSGAGALIVDPQAPNTAPDEIESQELSDELAAAAKRLKALNATSDDAIADLPTDDSTQTGADEPATTTEQPNDVTTSNTPDEVEQQDENKVELEPSTHEPHTEEVASEATEPAPEDEPVLAEAESNEEPPETMQEQSSAPEEASAELEAELPTEYPESLPDEELSTDANEDTKQSEPSVIEVENLHVESESSEDTDSISAAQPEVNKEVVEKLDQAQTTESEGHTVEKQIDDFIKSTQQIHVDEDGNISPIDQPAEAQEEPVRADLVLPGEEQLATTHVSENEVNEQEPTAYVKATHAYPELESSLEQQVEDKAPVESPHSEETSDKPDLSETNLSSGSAAFSSEEISPVESIEATQEPATAINDNQENKPETSNVEVVTPTVVVSAPPHEATAPVTNEPSPQDESTDTGSTQEEPAGQSSDMQSPSKKKKVIHPINDPFARPDLNALLAKEEEKARVSQIIGNAGMISPPGAPPMPGQETRPDQSSTSV